MESVGGAAAFVTGGASGIGLGFARALAERGAGVAVADVRQDHLDEARRVAEAEGWADRFLALRLDVTDRAAFAAALDETEAKLGPLRILANNAGVGIEGPMDEAGYAEWDWGMGVNLGGVINGLVAGLPRIKAHGAGGHVMNTASLGALIPARLGKGVYAAAKAAVVSMSEHLRVELADKHIGVSVLCPGPVKTNIKQSGRTRPAHLRESGSTAFLAREAELETREDMPEWLEPIDVGRMMVEAVLADRLYVFPHPAFLAAVKRRHQAIEEAME